MAGGIHVHALNDTEKFGGCQGQVHRHFAENRQRIGNGVDQCRRAYNCAPSPTPRIPPTDCDGVLA